MKKCEVLPGGKKEEVDSRVGLKANLIYKRSDEDIRADLEKLEKYLNEVQAGDLNFSQKMDALLKMDGLIVPELFRELTDAMPSVDKSMIASKAISAIKDMGTLLVKKREIETSEDINPNSPKFQLIFGWFIELFNMILSRQGLNTIQINNIFNDLSLELSGWEDKTLRRLKGLSSKALEGVENPLIDKVKKEKQIKGFDL